MTIAPKQLKLFLPPSSPRMASDALIIYFANLP
ncbi:hypothetical protein PanWU01x14_243790 [Parasponia andersonii]|uniref:Uncharacterized protein n=1 Tax=Parasponia andersonii TaxID=3476 RepID=A0A2P5BFF0_PARAD|nr:hypothetical protein PanWU01x14_243790 [Parasponia andersonii]